MDRLQAAQILESQMRDRTFQGFTVSNSSTPVPLLLETLLIHHVEPRGARHSQSVETNQLDKLSGLHGLRIASLRWTKLETQVVQIGLQRLRHLGLEV